MLVRHAMRYGQPRIAAELDALRAARCHARAGAAAVPAVLGRHQRQRLRRGRRLGRSARAGCRSCASCSSTTTTPATSTRWPAQVLAHWQRDGRGAMLVMSFHGVPERTLQLGDPYHCDCQKTARLLAERLGLPQDAVRVTFQSRFGKAQVAGALHRADAAAAGARRRRARRRHLPRLRRRLPGDAGGDRPGSARSLHRRRRQDVPLHRLPERPARMDRRAARHRAAPSAGLGHRRARRRCAGARSAGAHCALGAAD